MNIIITIKNIESLEKVNNTLKGKVKNCNPTEGKKKENMSKMKKLAVKKQRIRSSFQEEIIKN